MKCKHNFGVLLQVSLCFLHLFHFITYYMYQPDERKCTLIEVERYRTELIIYGWDTFPHFHKLCAHRLHAVFFVSVTFNKIMAMEEIKLTQNVHNEALSADVSGMVQTLS